MKAKKFFAWLFGLLGVCLMAGTAFLCLTNLDAPPKLVEIPVEARQCSEDLMDALCAGDHERAEALLAGQPSLGLEGEPEDPVACLAWDAFQDSLSYVFDGDCYAADTGLARNVTVTALDISAVVEALPAQIEVLLAEQLEEADDTSGWYDENGQFQAAFVEELLLQAMENALAENKQTIEKELTLQLIFRDGKWLVSADKALLEILSGGLA